MNKLKLAFKVASSKTTTQKALVKLINESSSDFSIEKHLNPILEGIYACSGTIEGLELYDTLLNSLKDCKPRLGVLKTLYICNHMVNMVGEPFSKVFLSEFFPNVLPPPRTHSTDDLAQGILAPNYYNFLLMYAKYYGDIQSYMAVKPEAVLAATKNGNHVPIVQLLTFKNILKYFTTIKGPLEVALGNLKHSGVTKKIAVRLFSDAANIYNMVTRFLRTIVVNIFDLERDMALLVDELYSDMIQVTKKILNSMEILNREIIEQLPPFDYFSFDAEFNQAEERYIFSVKKSQFAHQEQENDDKKEYIDYLQKYQAFKVGKKEYKVSVDIATVSKLNLDKKPSHQDLSGQSPSTKSSLVGSLTSPRMLVKRIEYQKSFTTPTTHQKLFISDNIILPQEIHSARTTRHEEGDNNAWNPDMNRTDTLPDLRESDLSQLENCESTPRSSHKSPRKQGSIVEDGLGAPSTPNLDWTSPRTKKLRFSGMFAKKNSVSTTKVNRQVIPSMY